jgi:hypothetical protein
MKLPRLLTNGATLFYPVASDRLVALSWGVRQLMKPKRWRWPITAGRTPPTSKEAFTLPSPSEC